MSTSTAFFSSILHVPNSKITNPNLGSLKIKSFPRKKQSHPVYPVPDNSPSSSCSCNSATVTNSLTLDHDSLIDDELKNAESKLGAKVRVKVPLKVYHVSKAPELELLGKIGVVKQYVGVYKGKRISANLPYKVEFMVDEVMGRDGKPVKFLAHLREDEFEFIESSD